MVLPEYKADYANNRQLYVVLVEEHYMHILLLACDVCNREYMKNNSANTKKHLILIIHVPVWPSLACFQQTQGHRKAAIGHDPSD